MRSTVEAGGADPDNARRSAPGDCDTLSGDRYIWREGDRLAVVLAGAAAGYGGDRRRPVTGGCRARQSPRPQSLRPKDASEAAAPQRRDPRVNPSRLRQVTLAAPPLDCSRPSFVVHGQAVRPGGRRCARETVDKKVVTARRYRRIAVWLGTSG